MQAKDWDWESATGSEVPSLFVCCCCGALWLADSPCDTGLSQTTCPAEGMEHSGCEWGTALEEEDMKRPLSTVALHIPDDLFFQMDVGIWSYEANVTWDTPVGEMEVRT